MSDRSPLTLDIHDALPDGYARAAARVFECHTAVIVDAKTIIEITQPGTTWLSADDVCLGAAADIAVDLVRLMDGDAERPPLRFGFHVWQDPKYEYPGTLHRYVPGGSLFTADCDADGNVTVLADQVRVAVAATGERDDLVAALSGLFGEDVNSATVCDPEQPDEKTMAALLAKVRQAGEEASDLDERDTYSEALEFALGRWPGLTLDEASTP